MVLNLNGSQYPNGKQLVTYIISFELFLTSSCFEGNLIKQLFYLILLSSAHIFISCINYFSYVNCNG